MEIILLERVDNLGELGAKVTVRPGYARNFLIPYGKAKFASAENIAEFEARRAELEKAAGDAMAVALTRKEALDGLEVRVTAKAGNEGKLFGSISAADIADAIVAVGVEAAKREVRLPDGPIRHLGEYDIDIHLYIEVDATIKLEVAAAE